MVIPVVDIFAGPGGLGEGFSELTRDNNKPVFKIALSIESEKFAHQTLMLRSFFRQFPAGEAPDEYYSYIKGRISLSELYRTFPQIAKKAEKEALRITLGETDNSLVDMFISDSIQDYKNWVLIGGPPCQAYSVVGRSRSGGIDPNDKRVFLYREYYRILAVFKPPVFVMENVKGLLSAKIDQSPIFRQILDDLKDPVAAFRKLNGSKSEQLNCPGYKIYSFTTPEDNNDLFNQESVRHGDYVIKSECYGIPQTRHRVILLGIRNDLNNMSINRLRKEEPVPFKSVISDWQKQQAKFVDLDGDGINDNTFQERSGKRKQLFGPGAKSQQQKGSPREMGSEQKQQKKGRKGKN